MSKMENHALPYKSINEHFNVLGAIQSHFHTSTVPSIYKINFVNDLVLYTSSQYRIPNSKFKEWLTVQVI